MQELKNSGFSIIRPWAATESATIIVVGVARSGTSMVASALRAMGVFLGDRAHAAVHEDVEIAAALEDRDEERLAELIELRNSTHLIWGFKRPESFRFLPSMLSKFRNPRLVVTFRDPAAISQRNAISMHTEFLDGLGKAAAKTVELIKFIGEVDVPVMAVSYEKAMFAPELFVESLAQFCGVEADDDKITAAIATMDNGPTVYLSSSRIWFEGRFGGIVNDQAFGWIRQMPANQPCHIEIVSNGEVIGIGKSDKPRHDLKDKIGDRAFTIKLFGPATDDVFARVTGTTHVLEKSPQFVNRYEEPKQASSVGED